MTTKQKLAIAIAALRRIALVNYPELMREVRERGDWAAQDEPCSAHEAFDTLVAIGEVDAKLISK